MNVPDTHPAIHASGAVHDLAHLDTFQTCIRGKGVAPATDLWFTVAFSCHVYTARAKHAGPRHMVDHNNTPRVFDPQRYAMSQVLPATIKAQIEGDGLTYVSQSFSGISNLIFLTDAQGQVWTIVYCLFASPDRRVLRMEVLSAYPRVIDQKKIARRSLSYFARKLLYGMDDRFPKD